MPFAVVGAAALAVHGVSRATGDVDVLVIDPTCLSAATWAPPGVAWDVASSSTWGNARR